MYCGTVQADFSEVVMELLAAVQDARMRYAQYPSGLLRFEVWLPSMGFRTAPQNNILSCTAQPDCVFICSRGLGVEDRDFVWVRWNPREVAAGAYIALAVV